MAQATTGYKHHAPFDSGFLRVSSIHKIHYEQYGNKDGKPVVFLHGGPGGSTSVKNTVFFNPSVYRVILFDQRGAGQSLPSGELRENTSQDLVSDIEVLRKHFGVHRWHVFGGSWGAVLSLLYAQTHPEAVVSLTLRGISFRGSCFETQAERGFDDVFQCTRRTHPEIFEELIGYLTMEERKDLTGSYSRRISSGDRTEELAAAKMYDKWAGVMSRLVPQEDNTDATITEAEEDHLIASSRIDCHYHAHSCWLREMHFLEPEKLEEIKHIPCGIVNGRYDQLCPPIMAWRLHKALPKSKLFIILDAGHSAAEPGTRDKLVEICDEFATLPI